MDQHNTSNINRKPNPVTHANVLSRLSYWWMRELFAIGFRKDIQPEHIYALKETLSARPVTDRFDELWAEELKKPNPSIFRVTFTVYGLTVLSLSFLNLIGGTAFRVIQPLCLGGLVSYFAPGQTSYTKGDAYWFTFGIIMAATYNVLSFHPFVLWMQERALNIRSGLSGLIYKKALSMSKAATPEGINGKMINLLSNDLSRFELALGFLHEVLKGPIEAVLFTYFLYQEIGIAAVIGITFLLSFIPLQVYIGKKSATMRLKIAERTDHRVKIMNQIVMGIQVIKMYAWELSFARLVEGIRKTEIDTLRQSTYIYSTMFSFGMISRLAMFVSVLSYIYLGSLITARKVFIVSSYFAMLNQSMVFFWPYALSKVAEAYVSLQRVQEFLLMSEEKLEANINEKEENGKLIKKKNGTLKDAIITNAETEKLISNKLVVEEEIETDKSIVLKNATALWIKEDESSVGIRDVSLKISEKDLCAIVGPVGSGKSSLLEVILGELKIDSGYLNVNGTVSYAAQEDWLFEGTVRSNIVFIESFDEERYNEVVRVCALERDFKLLPFGDMSIVGERGISLSGGQKARVNLARAIYKKADIYLLDDPLSAVDTRVGQHIFKECIEGFLRNKICVLVTHQLQHLTSIRNLVLLGNGTVNAQGTFDELRDLKLESLSLLPEGTDGMDLDSNERTRASSVSTIRSEKVTNGGELDDVDREETRGTGAVSWGVYVEYIRALDGIQYVIILFVLAQFGMTGLEYFIASWVNWEEKTARNHILNTISSVSSNDTLHITKIPESETTNFDELSQEANTRHTYVVAYCQLLVAFAVFYSWRTFKFFSVCLSASVKLHAIMFKGITEAKMFFYHNNTSGRILNRFSKDIGNVDTLLPQCLLDCVSAFVEVLAILSIVIFVNYWLLLPTFGMIFLFFMFRMYYIKTLRSLKRIESISYSPIYSHANATMQGLSTVRAFRANEVLQKEFHQLLDNNTSVWYLRVCASRAFAFWLDLVTLVYLSTVTLSFLVFNSSEGQSGNVGLVILQCINLLGQCQWAMRQTAEVESHMTSVERILEYADLPAEPQLKNPEKLRQHWPEEGLIEFQNLNFRYSPVAPFVLKDVNVRFEAGEKVGIVGRTGAGKSSIIQAIFRLAELDGLIKIDGVDINMISLRELRQHISIIPQDPVLFSGTLRFNLDPFGVQSDVDLWSALTKVKLQPYVSTLPGALDCTMTDGGNNFSVGQRQLVCLARAILRNNKILIMDEATANVDQESDKLIQATIRERFEKFTVLTIAHRLQTVMDNDKLLVIDDGKVVEFGHPYELLQRDGFLKKLVDKTGAQTAAMLTQTAKDVNFIPPEELS